MTTKRCSHCHRELPELFFYGDHRAKGGLSGRCRECNSEAVKRSKAKKNTQALPHHIDPSPAGSSD